MYTDMISMNTPPSSGRQRLWGQTSPLTPFAPKLLTISRKVYLMVFSCLRGWQAAESALSNIAYNIVERDTQNQWKMKEFTRLYDAQIEDKESYKCDSVMVYCNGSLLEDGSTVNICVVYFVGVYYTVTTERKKTRDLIRAEAYKSAAERAGVSAIPKIQKELKETLDVYTQKQFETEFGHKYADNPPTSLRAHDVRGGMLGRTSNVCYIPEGVDVGDAVRNYVENRVFKYGNRSQYAKYWPDGV
ncbi:hypothetical protein BJ165DRAFT_138344 [Panaeolus papilionaceus]|nr:hypothetical protein BJ165DRAFT_138344 [Panaeolus papilionaceus]